MNETEVRIVELQPFRAASFHAYGEGPETLAWEQVTAWAEANQVEAEEIRIFGFNNPDPSPGSPNYGYEYWVAGAENYDGTENVTLKDFSGGLYAVLRCEVRGNPENIGAKWRDLVTWMETSGYKHAKHQWLEEHFCGFEMDFNTLALDLYLPVAE